MLSCIRATALIEAKTHNPLSFIKNMQLELHVALCEGCRNYMEQTRSIHELLNAKQTPVSLSPEETGRNGSLNNRPTSQFQRFVEIAEIK